MDTKFQRESDHFNTTYTAALNLSRLRLQECGKYLATRTPLLGWTTKTMQQTDEKQSKVDTSLLQRYSATDQTWTPNLRTKGHPLHRYNATDWKKAQTKNTPPCYSATPLQTRREHIIWELRATCYTATILQTEKKGKSRERWMQTMWWQNGLCSREDGLSFHYECLNVCLNVYLPLKQGVKQFVSWS